jgi:hypothetical protein
VIELSTAFSSVELLALAYSCGFAQRLGNNRKTSIGGEHGK